MRVKGRSIILALVLLVSGFLVSFSYQQTKSDPEVVTLNESQWEKEYYYQQQLLSIEERNKQLRDELNQKREQIQQIENDLANSEDVVADLVDRKKKLQMLTGELPVEGPGVEVTLHDAEYIPDEENANNYIVHEAHVQKVINELLSSGAKAVSINGQRYFSDSYISCIGPVISVDGVQHPAPFVIKAIGEPDVLESSLNLTNGVVEKLVNDNVEVTMQKQRAITMEPRLATEG
ncbi:DUF881 domain-containing protein [Thalassobacillus sp. CUG 92003]|uniref:DUF881 domain-containing protein n=1 Tax=Thalassobacillus sp. CUG 92003 TaxID=2736641 RepID=UPI0015E7B558|nr:DUF881 domain-containing protein [Thalassobacillus sp. CUG 92003]